MDLGKGFFGDVDVCVCVRAWFLNDGVMIGVFLRKLGVNGVKEFFCSRR